MRATKELIAGVFGRAAAAYERAGPPFFAAVARRLVALTDLPAGACVLDVATGTGAALLEAAQPAGPAGMLVGVDLAGPMVAEARRRLREADTTDAVVLVLKSWPWRGAGPPGAEPPASISIKNSAQRRRPRATSPSA